MRRLQLIVFPACLLALCFGSPLPASGDPLQVSVQGRVFSSGSPFHPMETLASRSPLPNAFVLLQSVPAGIHGDAAVTDANGEFEFHNAPPGLYQLSLYVVLPFLPPQAGEPTFEGYSIDGAVTFFPSGIRVVDPGTVPRTQPFEVFEPGMPRTVEFGSSVTQGSGGNAVYGQPPATPGDSVTGYVVRPLGVTSATLLQVNFRNQLSGFADVPSEVVAGVRVRLTDFVGDPTYPRFLTSGADGGFEFASAFDADAGRVAVEVGGVFVQDKVVSPGSQTIGANHVVFVVPGRLGGFHGRAFVELGTPNQTFDGTDQALGGLTVRIFDPAAPTVVLATTTTGPDGTYTFPPDFEDGAYLLTVEDPARPDPLRAGALRAASSAPVDFAFTPENCPDFEDPALTCPGDITVECVHPDGEVVSFAATATDDCTPPDRIVLVTSPQGSGSTFSLGTTSVTVTATDLAGRSAQCTFDVTVQDTTPPTITLNGPSTIRLECGRDTYTELGATAADACDQALPPVTIGGDTVDPGTGGTYVVTYDVQDASGNDAVTVTRTVIVEDTTPPVISTRLQRGMLWPANGGLILPALEALAVDACDGAVAVRVTVFSDEGHGTGALSPDATGDSPANLRLRSERLYAGGNGRFYLIRITASDASGNTAVACHASVVPLQLTAASMAAVRTEAAAAEAACRSAPLAPTLPGLFTLLTFDTPPGP